MRRSAERAALGLALAALAWGPLAQGSTFWWGTAVLALLGGGALALAAVAFALPGPAARPARPLWVAAALAFLAWVWASVLWSPDPGAARVWAGVWTGALGAALALHLLATTPRRANGAVAVLLLAGGAAVVVAGLQARGVFLPGFQAAPGTPEAYLTGPYYHPSHFSGFLIPIAALVTAFLLGARPSWLLTPLLVLLAVGVQAANLRTDGSSIPAVMLAAFVPVIPWAWRRRRAFGVALAAATVAGVGGALLLLGTPVGRATFAAHQATFGVRSQNLDGFLRGRAALHAYGEAVWRAHPVAGAGIGQFITEAPRFRPGPGRRDVVDNGLVNYAHSDPLQVASELGTVGLALFALLLGATVWPRRRGVHPAWIGALAGLLFTAAYDAHLTAIPGTMAVAFGLAALPWARPERGSGRGSEPGGGPGDGGVPGGHAHV